MSKLTFDVEGGSVRVNDPTFSCWREGKVRLATFTPYGLFGWGIEVEFDLSVEWNSCQASKFADSVKDLIQ